MTLKEKDLVDHSENTREWSLAIADEMFLHLSPVDRDLLATSAALHDLGKIRIPDYVLKKPYGLSGTDWDIFHLHPYLGTQILRAFPGFEKEQEIILAHHERFDGWGYPNRISGQDIPIFSRIIAVADAYDAMVSSRVYKKAVEAKEAAWEISRNAGTHFDPAVVDAFQLAFASRVRSEAREERRVKDPNAKTQEIIIPDQAPKNILDEPEVFHKQGIRKYQEDRYVRQRIKLENVSHGRGWLLAVMDGHAGSVTADLLKTNLVRIFQDAMRI